VRLYPNRRVAALLVCGNAFSGDRFTAPVRTQPFQEERGGQGAGEVAPLGGVTAQGLESSNLAGGFHAFADSPDTYRVRQARPLIKEDLPIFSSAIRSFFGYVRLE
jgi:hypothetical protein